jgi:MoaA/NifB/PqqE/SkfB family radical SAM enzyme
MCDLWKSNERSIGEISSERWIDIIEELHEFIGPFFLTLTGGEVFVKKGIYNILGRFSRTDISLNILSNGIVFGVDRNLQKLLDTGLPSISFSIDGPDPEIHDRYRGTPGLHSMLTKVIRKIKQQKPEMAVTAVCIVMSDTISQLINYVYWANELGVDRVLFQPIVPNYGVPDTDRQWYEKSKYFVHDLDLVKRVMDDLISLKQTTDIIGNTVDNIEKMKDYFENPNLIQIKRSRCMIGQTNLNINEYGDISFCNKFDNKIGNVNDRPIKQTWRSMQAKKIRREIKRCRRPCMSLCYRTFTMWDKISLFFKYVRMGRI